MGSCDLVRRRPLVGRRLPQLGQPRPQAILASALLDAGPRTTGQTAAPVDVLKAAIVDLQGETEALDRGFRDGVAAVRERQMQI